MAERVGFEPTDGFPSSVFKTDAIDHSATSPGCCGRGVTYGGDLGLPSGSLIGVGACVGRVLGFRWGMRALIAVDKFKGSLPALAVAEAIAAGVPVICGPDGFSEFYTFSVPQ